MVPMHWLDRYRNNAFSSITGEIALMPGIPFILFMVSESGLKYFPDTGMIFRSESKLAYSFPTTDSKPLNAERIMIRAAEPKNIPRMDMSEITCITFDIFLEKKYLRAI